MRLLEIEILQQISSFWAPSGWPSRLRLILDELKHSLLVGHGQIVHDDEVIERSSVDVVEMEFLVDHVFGVNDVPFCKSVGGVVDGCRPCEDGRVVGIHRGDGCA